MVEISPISQSEAMSAPNDELASQNMISEPDQIEDSLASDFSKILVANARKRVETIRTEDNIHITESAVDWNLPPGNNNGDDE
mmetsp:Transcript_12543/g.16078  ORF Transcript_12543/g.16078 Transcript_12543/m.16078 type:complete len:83 (-) Transcript_12543:953-1201(-)